MLIHLSQKINKLTISITNTKRSPVEKEVMAATLLHLESPTLLHLESPHEIHGGDTNCILLQSTPCRVQQLKFSLFSHACM